MKFLKKFLLLITLVSISGAVNAQEYYGHRHLTSQEIDRVRQVKELLSGVDTKPLRETIKEIEKSKHPQTNIELQEAMAHAFLDIAKENNVEGIKKKQWLYSMVCLNMAYLQFGGTLGKYGSTTELNRLIRQKLIAYLPRNINTQPGFLNSLE